jgi:hypothetical protein
LEPLAAGQAIDAGAEEELFRRIGQQAAREALVRRWEQADLETEPECRGCHQRMKGLGQRARQLRTLCGEVRIERRVYYCSSCQQTEAPLDRQLGLEQSGLTAGLARVVCRTALELAYQQSQHLLTDTLGFTPCSAREVERIAKQNGRVLEARQPDRSRQEATVRPRSAKRAAHYCLAIDGVMIAGLPDADTHCINWHEVKLATGFDPRQLQQPFYVAGRDNAQDFGTRLWGQIEGHGLDERSFLEMLGDGAPWIWNLAEEYLPGVPQLLDFYHAAEHLYATAQAVWPESAIANRWWQQRLDQLRCGQEANFFAALQLLAKRHRTQDPAVSPQRLLTYFQDNRERLNYRWALRRHLPIGSGQVESAARHIVQQRLKQSGMRWSDPGAQAILNLRTLHRNGEFEQYWENRACASASR